MKGTGFALDKQEVEFTHVNLRIEKHGPAQVKMVDLSLKLNLANIHLGMFDPGLKPVWYEEDEQLFGGTEAAAATQLRETIVKPPYPLTYELPGADVAIAFGIESELKFNGIKFTKFSATPKNGGTVEIAFQGKSLPVSSDDMVALFELLGGQITLTITPTSRAPDLADEAESEDQDEDEQEAA